MSETEEITFNPQQQEWINKTSAAFNSEGTKVYSFIPAHKRSNLIFVYLLQNGDVVDEILLEEEGYSDHDGSRDYLTSYKTKLLFRQNRQLWRDQENAGVDYSQASEIPLKDLERFI